jgi:hypothetical protein
MPVRPVGRVSFARPVTQHKAPRQPQHLESPRIAGRLNFTSGRRMDRV